MGEEASDQEQVHVEAEEHTGQEWVDEVVAVLEAATSSLVAEQTLS